MANLRLRQSGGSLIEILIASAIICAMALTMASMFTRQQTEIRALYQKSEALELKNLLITVFTNSGICTWQLANRSVDVASTTPTAKSPTVIDFGNTPLYSGLNNTSAPLATAGQLLPGSTHGLRVSRILFKNIIATGNANEFMGTFEIQFDEASLAIPMKPVQVQQLFTTDSIAATAKIVSCSRPNIHVINPDSGFDGQSGTNACASVGKKCSYVISHQSIWVDSSCGGMGTHCMRVCATWYNQSLPGVPNKENGNWSDPGGSGHTNLHSCDANVGRYTTYLNPGVVRCGGYFSAICN